jgi:RNA polymerase-binding transcription factor DksA
MPGAAPGAETDPVAHLRGLRDELESQLVALGELDEDGARPKFSNHLAEDAQDQQQRHSDMALRQVLLADMRTLDHAIQRGLQGQYGLCEDCGHEIPPRRLEVVPGTTLCVTCQSRRETSRTPM